MIRMGRGRMAVAVHVAVVAALAMFPWFGTPYDIELVIRLMILAILAVSLDLLVGVAGMVSLGHAAFFGVAAYTLAVISPDSGNIAIWWALPACLAVAATAAAAVGALAIRTTGASFIMITLAFAQMGFYFAAESAELGGTDGLFVWSRPDVVIAGRRLFDLDDSHSFYLLVLGSLVAAYLLLAALRAAPFGRVLTALRIDPRRTRALGYDLHLYRLTAFVIAGTLAGLAGFLEACHSGYVSPGLLGWQQSGLALVIVILGGAGSLYGPVLAAFVLGLARDRVQDLTEHWALALGVFVVALVLLLPKGLAGLLGSGRRSRG